jgi:hypothetical protein
MWVRGEVPEIVVSNPALPSSASASGCPYVLEPISPVELRVGIAARRPPDLQLARRRVLSPRNSKYSGEAVRFVELERA